MKHKHAELMALYAQDATETDKPWERWECRYDSEPWEQLQHQPMWDNQFSYRRKPMPKEITEQSDVDIKMRAAASAAARSVPEDQIEDVIKWTENYLETLKSRTLVSPTDMWTDFTRVCKRVVELEYALRDIALFVSVGGYNDYTLPEDIAQRIKDGIIALIRNNTNNQQPDHQ